MTDGNSIIAGCYCSREGNWRCAVCKALKLYKQEHIKPDDPQHPSDCQGCLIISAYEATQ